MSIGDRIRQRRKELGLTQTELGKLVHKSSQVISNWERSYTTGIAPDDLRSLAFALNTSVQFFIPSDCHGSVPLVDKESSAKKHKYSHVADKRLKSLIDSYPMLDDKSKDIIEAIIKLSNNDTKEKA